MKRPAFLGIALLGVLGGSPAGAQQAGKTYRVGILTGGNGLALRPDVEAFRRTLAGLGYQEGRNLEIIFRAGGGDFKRDPALVADLLRTNPDAIVAVGNLTVAAAQRATTSVPIVMAGSTDPVGRGFVASLARPGANITGVTAIDNELIGKRLQLLKEFVPHLKRVAVIGDPSDPSNLPSWRIAQSEARKLGVTSIAVDIRSPDQIDSGLKTIPQLHTDAILVFAQTLTVANSARIARQVAMQRLPAIYGLDKFTIAGGLISYGVSVVALWSQAATYVDRILKGTKPADLPVERPTTFELVVNLKAARDIGITFPQSILLQATQVIR